MSPIAIRATPGISTGWPGVGTGKVCGSWPVGTKLIPPIVVSVSAPKPPLSWKAFDTELIALI